LANSHPDSLRPDYSRQVGIATGISLLRLAPRRLRVFRQVDRLSPNLRLARHTPRGSGLAEMAWSNRCPRPDQLERRERESAGEYSRASGLHVSSILSLLPGQAAL